jgi:hypothetical protein
MRAAERSSNPGSRIRGGWFLLGSLLTLLGSVGMGLVLYLAYQGQLHVALFTPLVLLLPVHGS